MKVSPCKGCADRSPGCHDRCDKYRAWKDERQKELDSLKEPFLSMSESNLRRFWREQKYRQRKKR